MCCTLVMGRKRSGGSCGTVLACASLHMQVRIVRNMKTYFPILWCALVGMTSYLSAGNLAFQASPAIAVEPRANPILAKQQVLLLPPVQTTPATAKVTLPSLPTDASYSCTPGSAREEEEIMTRLRWSVDCRLMVV